MNIDTTFDLLADPVRRGIVTALRGTESVSRDRLVATLASDEDAHEQLRIALHHNHLPKLADAGLVTYDDETVTATDRIERVACQFDAPDRESVRPVPL